MRRFVLAAIAVVVLLTAPRPARACSCDSDTRVTPGDGAIDVPTNVVFVVLDGPDDVGPTAYVLEGPDGAVALELTTIVDQSTYGLQLARPLSALEPLTSYALRAPPIDIVFETGAGADVIAPEPPILGELILARADVTEDIGSSCGNEYSFVDLAITPPADAVAVDIFVDVAGVRSQYVIPVERIDWGLSSWSSGCGIKIALVAGERTCFEVRSRDAAGNRSSPVERCANVTACADILDPKAVDHDLTDCEPQVEPELPASAGCYTGTSAPEPLAVALLALLAVRRRTRRSQRLVASTSEKLPEAWEARSSRRVNPRYRVYSTWLVDFTR